MKIEYAERALTTRARYAPQETDAEYQPAVRKPVLAALLLIPAAAVILTAALAIPTLNIKFWATPITPFDKGPKVAAPELRGLLRTEIYSLYTSGWGEATTPDGALQIRFCIIGKTPGC